MAGSPTCGKISTGIRLSASSEHSATASTAMRIVMGRLRAARTSRMLTGPVAGKLFKHTEPKDWWFMDRMMEDMKADEAGVKILVFCSCRRAHSKRDIEFRLQSFMITRW